MEIVINKPAIKQRRVDSFKPGEAFMTDGGNIYVVRSWQGEVSGVVYVVSLYYKDDGPDAITTSRDAHEMVTPVTRITFDVEG